MGLQVVGAELERRGRDDGYGCGARANEKLVGETRVAEIDASPERGRIKGDLPPFAADLRPGETVLGPAMAAEPRDADGEDGLEDLVWERGNGEERVEVSADGREQGQETGLFCFEEDAVVHGGASRPHVTSTR